MRKKLGRLIIICLLVIIISITSCGTGGTGGLEQIGSITGDYVNENNPNEYMTLYEDGTFYLKEGGYGFDGTWEVKGSDIILHSSLGMAARGEIKGNKLYDEDGKVWVKVEDSEEEVEVITSKIEVAGTNFDELIQLCEIVREVTEYAGNSANNEQRQLLYQVNSILGTVHSDSQIENIVLKQTEEEELVSSFLAAAVGALAQQYLGIPSLIASSAAKGLGELSRLVGQWLEMKDIAYVTITVPDMGTIGLVYQRDLSEIWVDSSVYSPDGSVNMYIPVEYREIPPDNAGSSAAAILLKPVLEDSRVAYRFGVLPTSTATIPTTTQAQYQGKIAFISDRDGGDKIYVMSADGSGQELLTNISAIKDYPAWSPDGSKIAFVSESSGNREIYIINTDGTNQIRLTNNAASDESPTWSPNGDKIAFVSDRDGNKEIYVMNTDGSGQTRLTNNTEFDHAIAWSPEGTKIAFHSIRDDNYEIYVMNADGSDQKRLTHKEAYDFDPAWSPDGKTIAFESQDDVDSPYSAIYIINIDGSEIKNLTNGKFVIVTFAWSPDGKKFTFSAKRDITDTCWDIYFMNNDGSNQTCLTDNINWNRQPTWSPDNKKIAFISGRDGNWEIYLMNADGSVQMNLTDNSATDWYPVWSPC